MNPQNEIIIALCNLLQRNLDFNSGMYDRRMNPNLQTIIDIAGINPDYLPPGLPRMVEKLRTTPPKRYVDNV